MRKRGMYLKGVAALLGFTLTATSMTMPVKAAHETSENTGYHWEVYDGKSYWYENGKKQGTVDDPQGVIGDNTVRGREICDPEILDAKGNGTWFWLDAVYDGAKAVSKEVWMPYIYQNEKDWDDEMITNVAKESGDMAAQVEKAIRANKDGVTDSSVIGKWVRYDADGKMIKGWYTVEGEDAKIYPEQKGNTYYYDFQTGLMAKGTVTIDGKQYTFDTVTGTLSEGNAPATEEQKPTGDQKPTDDTQSADPGVKFDSTMTIEEIAKANVGNIVAFGTYEQDNNKDNGAEPIAWYVVDKTEKNITLLSVYLLDCVPYHNEFVEITWERSSMREWLNDDFYNTAFTQKEAAYIDTVKVQNKNNPFWGTKNGGKGGNDTQDKIWLLSLEEIEKYFNVPMGKDTNPMANGSLDWLDYFEYCYQKDHRLRAPVTAYTKKQFMDISGITDLTNFADEDYYDSAKGSMPWWLRSPGIIATGPCYVRSDGGVVITNIYDGEWQDDIALGVRPALQLSLSDAEEVKGRNGQAMGISQIAKAKEGDTVTFGAVEQDGDYKNGKEPIAWYILEKTDSEMVLMSVDALFGGVLNSTSLNWYPDDRKLDPTWENSHMRWYLNGFFCENAFTEKETSHIVLTKVENKDNPITGCSSGNDTEDKVWILSLDEIEKYFNIPLTKETNPYWEEKKNSDGDLYIDFASDKYTHYEYGKYCYDRDHRIVAKPTENCLQGKDIDDYYSHTFKDGVGYDYGKGCTGWCLRTLNYSDGKWAQPAYVNYLGEVKLDYSHRDNSSFDYEGGVRPVIKIAYK